MSDLRRFTPARAFCLCLAAGSAVAAQDPDQAVPDQAVPVQAAPLPPAQLQPAQLAAPALLDNPLPERSRPVELTQHRRSGVVSAWLENGVRVQFRALATPPGQVVLTICLFGGELFEDQATRGLSRLTVAALDDALNPATAPPEFRKQLEQRDVHVDGIAATDALMLRIWGSVDDVAFGARLAGRELTDLSPDPAAVTRARETIIQETAKYERAHAARIARSIEQLIYPCGDVRTSPVSDAQLARYTGQDVRDWLTRHAGPQGVPIEVSVVGDVTLDQAIGMAREAVGRLADRPRVTSTTLSGMRHLPRPAGPLEKTIVTDTPDHRATVVAGFVGIDITKPSQVRLCRSASRVLQSRVRTRLEAAGLTHKAEDCDAGVWLSSDPGFGLLIMLARVDADRPEAASTILNDEIDRLSVDGPTADELHTATESLAAEVQRANADPRYWSGFLARCTAQGVDPDEVFAGAEYYRSLTPQKVLESVHAMWKPGSRIGLIIKPPDAAPGAP